MSTQEFFDNNDIALQNEWFPEEEEGLGTYNGYVVRQVLRFLRSHIQMQTNRAYRDRYEAVDAEKRRVVELTLDYSAGCIQGKVDYLESLGYEEFIPKKKARVVLVVDMPMSYQESSGSLADEMASDVNSNTTSVQDVTVESYEWMDE